LTKDEALKIVLSVLGPTPPECCGCAAEWKIAIDAAKEALAQPAQELVMAEYKFQSYGYWKDEAGKTHFGTFPPPQPRPWVGLTDDQFSVDKAVNAMAQPAQEPVAWRNAAIRLGEELSSVGPDGYYDMTAEQWFDWAMEQEPQGKNSLAQPAQEPVASEKIHDLQTMLDVLRIKQTVKFDDCSALFGEVARKTGMKPPPFELSGNQWCALVNLAVAKFAAPPAAQPAQEPVAWMNKQGGTHEKV